MSEWRDYSQPAAPGPASLTAEERRLQEARAGVPWRAWGPYLSERQWGTVREDYSDNGDAWSYFSHDQARSRAYRWGEDGIAGISDDKQRLCLALALGQVDLAFLQESFARLLLNFTWWVNRKDIGGRNVFEGGFLGLDNIGVFDRSAALPTGGRLEQADGTAWMAMFSQNMLELALGLLEQDGTYEGFALKFVEHFFWIAAAVDPIGEHPDEMWDEEDGFFYDVLRLPDGTGTRLKVRSLVGLLPICATTVIEADIIERYPQIAGQVRTFLERNQDLLANIADPLVPGVRGRRILSLVNEEKLRRILARMLDEERFLGRTGSARSHAGTSTIRTPSTYTAPSIECSTSRPSRPAACSAGTPTGAGRSGSRSTCS